jgi:hypothetical protein
VRSTYILPLRSSVSRAEGELTDYLRWLSPRAETIVVDGSAPDVFAAHAAAWGGIVRHLAPAPDLATPMGKVGGVLTGVRMASHERLIIADDDVRYDEDALDRIVESLGEGGADVVRPQNYFTSLPWHACWDTGRTLLNRVSGGDWPGTLGVRRSILQRTGGYDGRAMFENLELVRTVVAAGGREAVPLDLFVARHPPEAPHFFSQRVRQAYDEIARPARLALQLAVLPATVAIARFSGWRGVVAAACVVAVIAEVGRQRANGTCVFPPHTSLFAPAWLAERAVCSWMAVGARIAIGGVPYRGTVLRHAATPMRVLRARPIVVPSEVERPAFHSLASPSRLSTTTPRRSA